MREIKAVGGRFQMGYEDPEDFSLLQMARVTLWRPLRCSVASVERPWPPFVLCGATCEVKPFLSAVCPPPLGLTDLKGAIVRKPE